MKNDAKYLKVGLTSNTTYLFFSMDILITLDVHRTKTSYPPGYPEKKIKRYKAQKLFSELNTDLSMHTIKTASTFTSIFWQESKQDCGFVHFHTNA